MMLTVEEVQRRVEAIRQIARDDEEAHLNEDALHQFVLQEIAEGRCADIAGCASEALRTREIDFNRWCA